MAVARNWLKISTDTLEETRETRYGCRISSAASSAGTAATAIAREEAQSESNDGEPSACSRVSAETDADAATATEAVDEHPKGDSPASAVRDRGMGEQGDTGVSQGHYRC